MADATRNPMTDLNEKATSARDVVRAGELDGVTYRLQTTELTDADDIGGDDDFPQFGEFLDVTAVDADHDDLGPRWVECPADLARELVEAEVGAGDVFTVTDAGKTEDGAWTFEVEDRA